MADHDPPALTALLADARAQGQTAQGRRPVTWGTLGEVLVRVGHDTKQFIQRTLAPHAARLEALEARVRELEQRPVGATYKGTWRADVTYAEHEMITDRGSCWIARSANLGTRPGSTPAWQLAVKAGRDGRDAR